MQSIHTVPGAWDVIKNIGIDVVLTAVYGLSSEKAMAPHDLLVKGWLIGSFLI